MFILVLGFFSFWDTVILKKIMTAVTIKNEKNTIGKLIVCVDATAKIKALKQSITVKKKLHTLLLPSLHFNRGLGNGLGIMTQAQLVHKRLVLVSK